MASQEKSGALFASLVDSGAGGKRLHALWAELPQDVRDGLPVEIRAEGLSRIRIYHDARCRRSARKRRNRAADKAVVDGLAAMTRQLAADAKRVRQTLFDIR